MSAPEAEATIEAISFDESKRLVELEACIRQHIIGFMAAGEALAEIRDKRLYRIEHATFEDYCRVKWKMSDRRARQLMDAVEVVETIGKSGTRVPVSEKQVRPLTKLEPEQQAAAWEGAVGAANGEQPTPKQVELAAEKVSQSEKSPEDRIRDSVMRQMREEVNACISSALTLEWERMKNRYARIEWEHFVSGVRSWLNRQ